MADRRSDDSPSAPPESLSGPASSKSAPSKSGSSKSAPSKSGATKSAPSKSAPSKSGSSKSAPSKSGASKSAPSKSGASKSGSGQPGSSRRGGDETEAPSSSATETAPHEMTEQIRAAYASSAPVLSGQPAGKGGQARGPDRVTGGQESTSKALSGDRPAAARAAVPTAAPAQKASTTRGRRARLRITHVDPWSVMKTSFLLAVALGIVTVVAVGVVWSVLAAAGVWESINATVSDVVGENGESFRIEDYLGMSRVMGFTMIVAVVDVVLVTVIATLGAFLYNLAAVLLGGIEVVLAEEDH